MASLEYLDVSQNLLTGEIPSTFYELDSLTTAYLSNNTFTGEVSPSISNLTSIQELWLDGNKLEGAFPSVDANNLQNLGKCVCD